MSNVVQGPTKYTCNSCGNIFEGKWDSGVLDIFEALKIFGIFKGKKTHANIFKARGAKCPKCKSKDISVLPIIYWFKF